MDKINILALFLQSINVLQSFCTTTDFFYLSKTNLVIVMHKTDTLAELFSADFWRSKFGAEYGTVFDSIPACR